MGLQQTARVLIRSRAYSLSAVLTMAVGLAAATAVVAVTSAVLLRPLPYPKPDRLFRLNASMTDPSASQTLFTLSPIEVVRLQQQARTLEQVEAFSPTEMALNTGGSPETLKVGAVSPGFLRLFGLQSTIGRDFTAEEDAQRLPVAVLDGGTWTRRFGRDPNIVGQTIRLDGTPYVVVGVSPRRLSAAAAKRGRVDSARSKRRCLTPIPPEHDGRGAARPESHARRGASGDPRHPAADRQGLSPIARPLHDQLHRPPRVALRVVPVGTPDPWRGGAFHCC